MAPAQHESVALLKAELEGLGLEVVSARLADAPVDAPSPTRSADAPEEFRIVLRPTHVEVWIFDRAAGKVTLREVFAESDGTPLDTRTAVLHAVELLHWHLRERFPRTRRAAPAKDSPAKGVTAQAAPPPAAPTPERRLTWSISLAPRALYSPGGTSLGVGAQIDVDRRWSQLAVRLFAASALVPNELVSSEGSAQVTSRFLGLEAVLFSSEALTPSDLQASVGLGVALVSNELRGRATRGYAAHDDWVLTAAPILELRVSYVVTDSVAIDLCSSVMTPLRASRLRFGEREAGRYGQLVATLGIGPRIAVF